MVNRVVLVGRLTKDPEMRRTSNDVPLVTFQLAVNRPFRNQQGETDADFIRCVVWRRQAENVEKYVSKGNMVGVDGRIQSRTYDDQDGNRRYVTEVVADSVQFLEPKGTQPPRDMPSSEPRNNQEQSQKQEEDSDLDHIDIADDDLPF